jgi:hypothetical protein
MLNYYNIYTKWLEVSEVEVKKWLFFKERKIQYQDRYFTKQEFLDSCFVLFNVLSKIENAGYDIAIFYDEVRLEPNLRYKHHVPPIHVTISRNDFTDKHFNKFEAIQLTIAVFTKKWQEYVKH